MMINERFNQQINFIIELDKLKDVLRKSYLIESNRRENSAEHSWHLMIMASTLTEYSNEQVDLFRVLMMLLFHDVVEIDAGDTYCYDAEANLEKLKREKIAAKKIFSLLPIDFSCKLHDLWNEFEKQETPESRFATALDRLMPLLHNYYTKGKAWLEHEITKNQVIERNIVIQDGSKTLWKFAKELIEDAVLKGYLIANPSGDTAIKK